MAARLRQLPSRMTAAEYRGLALAAAPALRGGRRSGARGHSAFSPSQSPSILGAGRADYSELPFRVSLPFLPPSVNKLFATVTDDRTGLARRVLTRHARRIRKLIQALARGRLRRDRLYELHIVVRLKAFTSKGLVRQVDLTNRVKFLEDCVCGALGIDDRQVFRVVLDKVHSDIEQTELTIYPWRAEGRADAA